VRVRVSDAPLAREGVDDGQHVEAGVRGLGHPLQRAQRARVVEEVRGQLEAATGILENQ
jgi:hypothetical protein